MRHSTGSPAVGPIGSACAALLGVGIFAAALASGAAHADPNGLSISGQWFRMIIPSRPAAGYFVLSNATGTPQRLVGADSPACGSLMLHETRGRGGVDSMMMVPSLTVPAHGKVALAPGGYHLMCTPPTAMMKRGQSVPVTLHFAGGETLEVGFPVRGATGK